MKEQPQLNGILLVDKPKDFTSHDIVSIARGALGTKKVGHCGTLDPNATGLLVLVVGVATKFSNQLTGSDKTYQGIIRLGIATTTYDSQGEITDEKEVPDLSTDEIQLLSKEFTGEISQIPPMVSAIKKDGVPLYKLARKGMEVEREPRIVTISKFEIQDFKSPDITFEVDCSKGTYVRSLAFDLGKIIGTGAHLLELRRTKSGKFNVADAIDGKELKTIPREEARQRLITISELLEIYTPEELTGKRPKTTAL